MAKQHQADDEQDAPAPLPFRRPIPVRARSRRQSLPFDLAAEAPEKPAIAEFLGLEALNRLSFRGEILPLAEDEWRVEGQLRAEVVQICVVTLEPVTNRIREDVARDYMPEEEFSLPEEIDFDPESEDEPDPYGTAIDLGLLALESLSLALDPYPRAQNIPPVEIEAIPPGAKPLSSDELKPFAKLGILKEKFGEES